MPRPSLRDILRTFYITYCSRSALDDSLLLAALRFSATAEYLHHATETAKIMGTNWKEVAEREVVIARKAHQKSIDWYNQIEAERGRRDAEADRQAMLLYPFLPPLAALVPPEEEEAGDNPPGL